MERQQLLIGKLLIIGLLISITIILIGGIDYIIHYGSQMVHDVHFKGEREDLTHISGIFRSAMSLSPKGIIQAGLWLLVFTQILRLLLTLWLFVKMKDKKFIWITVFVTSIVIYTCFFH